MAVVLLVVFSVAPLAQAGWGAKGSWEPDLQREVVEGYNFVQPDTVRTDANPPVRKVYFNGFIGQCTFPCYLPASSFNPNVATMRTAHGSTLMYLYAMLGVWKDCNKDGFVGVGDQGLFEYRAELLLDKSVCKVESTPIVTITGKPPLNWFPSHNDGQWVREFLPIEWYPWNDVTGDPNSWNVNDNASRVWVDGGVPESDLSGGGTGCLINPQPRGTYRSTGGLVEYGDCSLLGWRVTDSWNTVVAAVGGDGLGVGQLSFNDKPRDPSNSASILNQKNPWGDEAQASYVEAWDCSQPRLVSVPIRDTGPTVNVSRPRTSPGVSTSGSPAGTMNSTGAGFDECSRTTTNDNGGLLALAVGGKLHYGHTLANLPYSNEYVPGASGSKIGTVLLTPQQERRPVAPSSTVLGKATPPDYGARAAGWDGFWNGGAIVLSAPWAGANGPAGAWHVTYYAYVGAKSVYGLTLPKTTNGVYGADACSGATAGIVKGWNCDRTAWWKDANGNSIEPRNGALGPGPDGLGQPVGIRVGDAYNLRDIDCYDESVKPLRDQELGWPTLSGNPVCVDSA